MPRNDRPGIQVRFDALSRATRALWAKSGEHMGHGLLTHLLDVAAVAERLLLREPSAGLDWARQSLRMPDGDAVRTLATLAGLHDLGKALPGFQAKWPDGAAAAAAAGLPITDRLRMWDRHDLASARLLTEMLHTHASDRAGALAEAVAAHHGYLFTPSEIASAVAAGEPAAWSAARTELLSVYFDTLRPGPLQGPIPELPTLAWMAGLTSVSDWIGSSLEWLPPGERATTTLEAYHADAQLRADQALDAIRWPRFAPLTEAPPTPDDLIASLTGLPCAAACPLQRAGAELLAGTREPVLMVVEAPMGEGKTELAFLAHLQLQASLGHRGLYIGLPTQATGNAMFDRTLQFLRTFSHDAVLDIQLAHGGAGLQDDRLLPLRDIAASTAETIGSSAWFAQRRRPLLSPYGVGTIDQALLGTLNVQHHFVRLWGLSNRVVVLDEVHAYDTYTSTLIESLLRWLKALRCSVLLMSATLPRDKRNGLLQAWTGRGVTAPELPYPRVLVAESDVVRGQSFDAREQTPIAVDGLDHGLQVLADHAAAKVLDGGCGAVVVNTVDRAQQLWLLLRERLAGTSVPMLFHARFPGDERQRHERAVLATFGRDAARPEHALLVATQVVEQSLDIDFDWLITDLAPIDLLLQRAGRLHRHTRARPAAHAEPRLTVAGLLADRLPELKKTAWGAVYDEYVLLRTWALASHEPFWRLPQDIDRLVQDVYGSNELPSGLAPGAMKRVDEAAYGAHLAATGNARRQAQAAVLDARQEFDLAYAGKPRGSADGDFPGVRNVTRLGPESLVVVPVVVDGEHWRADANAPPFDPRKPLDPAAARRLVERQVRLSRRELVKSLKAIADKRPIAFTGHPWLAHCHPLPLIDGACTLGPLQVRLDPSLGIVYTSTAAPEEKPLHDR